MKLVKKIVLLSLIATCFLWTIALKNCLAEQNLTAFQKDASYDIYYALQDHVQYISDVKIIGTTTIEEITFLKIEYPGISKERTGYIALSSIQAILPAGSPKPQNIKNR
ncbi:MAG: hypothetical protein ABIC68_08355 [Candidatus Omnitrophota bacterium]